MTKIKKIEINDFRGFDGLRTFDFDDAEIIIFLGMNGFGKTSIFDAVEWCLTGHLGRYERYLEVGRKQDFGKEKEVLRNKYSSNQNTFVKVHLSDEKKFGRRVAIGESGSDYNTGSIIDGFDYGVKSISMQEMGIDLIHNYFSATHILSQETINHFVTSKKPEDRYRALSVNFGTSLYDPFGDNVQNLLQNFRDQGETLKIRGEENLKRLSDLKSQILVKTDQIEVRIKKANEITAELNKTTNDFGFIKYCFVDDKIVSKNDAKHDLHYFVSSIQISINELKNKLETIGSIRHDYESWVLQNKDLNFLDSHVLDYKQLLSRLRELQSQILSLRNEEVTLNLTIERETTELNILNNIKSLLPNFLKAKIQVEKHTGDITNRNSLAKENKTELSSVAETLLKSEQDLKFIKEKNQELDSIMLIIADQQQKNGQINQRCKYLENEYGKTAAAISTDQNQKTILKRACSIMDANFDIVEEETTSVFLNLVPTLDKHIFEEIVKKKVRISEISTNIKIFIEKISILESDAKEKTQILSKFNALLVAAIEFIHPKSPKSHCPVCKDLHDTNTLLDSITERLDGANSHELEQIKTHISGYKKSIKDLKEEEASIASEISEIKSKIKEEIQSKTYSIEKALENHSAMLQEIKTELQQIEEDRLRLFVRISSALNTKITNLESAKALCEIMSNDLKNQENGFKVKIEKSIKQKNKLLIFIQSLLDENSFSEQQINLLNSDDFRKVGKYIVEKGFTSNADFLTQTVNLINNNEEALFQTMANLKAVINKKLSLELELNELRGERTELQIENDINKATSRITEISRFLSDYKERCSRVNLDLGDISLEVLEKTRGSFSKILEQQTKVLELLWRLVEIQKDFMTFNHEDSLRKKIVHVENESKTLASKIQRVKTAKRNIDDLKKEFPKILEKYIKNNLDVELFNKIYQSINPHRRFKNIDFVVNVSHNKVGINFKAKQFNITARPEFLFSSAQLNTFGVSMFLSMALRQNWLNLDTVLLDDPIQNLDDINILSFIDLIRGLLDLQSGKQVIMSTHDERFYNLVKHKFSDYKLKAFRFESYGRVTPDLQLLPNKGN